MSNDSNNNDLYAERELEDELAKSIAQIVDEETSGAEIYYKNSVPKDDTVETIIEDDPDLVNDEEEPKKETSNKKKLLITISVIAVAMIVVGIAAYFLINVILNKINDTYDNSYKLGYEAFDKKEYENAVSHFEKALTFEESNVKSDSNINMMLRLYDCYTELGKNEEADKVLDKILSIDSNNYYALYYLVSEYEKTNDWTGFDEFYEKHRNSPEKKVIELLSKYDVAEPKASETSGSYQTGTQIVLSAENAQVYFTTDGTSSFSNGVLYTDPIVLSEGTNEIKFYAKNSYGIKSKEVIERYVCQKATVKAPEISPKSGSYQTDEKQLITISGATPGAKIYYTDDGTRPTTESNEYTEPFEMKKGSSVIYAMYVDEQGNTSNIATAIYKLDLVDKYDASKASSLIYETLIEQKKIDDKHLDADGTKYILEIEGKKTIETDEESSEMWIYKVKTEKDDESAYEDYVYGLDSSTGYIYYITVSGDKYSPTLIKKN